MFRNSSLGFHEVGLGAQVSRQQLLQDGCGYYRMYMRVHCIDIYIYVFKALPVLTCFGCLEEMHHQADMS